MGSFVFVLFGLVFHLLDWFGLVWLVLVGLVWFALICLVFFLLWFDLVCLVLVGLVWFDLISGAHERGPAPPPPSMRAPLRGWEVGSFNITSACISLPQARHSGVPRGSSPCCPPGSSRRGTAPPGKYKIERKLSLKSNTWQWQRLRICLNSLLIQREKSSKENTSLHKMYYMTESWLNDLALKALHPKRMSELSTEKIIEMFVQANPRKL